MLRILRTELFGVAVAVAVAAAAFLLLPTVPNFDAYYHLVWGQELVAGQLPSFQAPRAPTEHPLFILITTALTPFGDDADRILVALSLLCLVALAWAAYRLGAATLGRWPGLAGAVFVATSVPIVLYALRAYVDVWFLALVVWAAALEAESRHRGVPVMGLLALAGLLRPEAWLIAGLYWLTRVRRAGAGERVALSALLVAPPLAWATVDVLVTGDPLHSLHATNALVLDLDRERGVANLPGTLVPFLVEIVKPPVAIAALVGVAAALARRGARAIAVPLGLLGAGLTTYVAIGVAELSLLPRYLALPAVVTCIFAGYAALGWTEIPRSRPLRRWWAGAAATVAVVSVGAGVVLGAPTLLRMERHLATETRVQEDLRRLVREPQVVAFVRSCGKLTFPSYRIVPNARFLLDGSRRVRPRHVGRPSRAGVAVHYVDRDALVRFGFTDGSSPRNNIPAEGFRRGPAVGALATYLSCRRAAG